jgi:hypothetical protein
MGSRFFVTFQNNPRSDELTQKAIFTGLLCSFEIQFLSLRLKFIV